MKRLNHKTLTFVATLIALLLIPASYGNAASILQVSMDEMLQKCQFVFEGKVTVLEAKKNSQNRIHTYVTFEIHEVIKGEYPNEPLILSFLGGTVDGVTMAVSDMRLPQPEEHGIYFVESLERLQVHPLYGWSQGHFLVKPDDTGTDRIMTSSKQPVIEVVGDIPFKQMTPEKAPLPSLSNGVARGITLVQEKKDNRGMTIDEFKKVLRERMRKAQ